MKIAMSSIIKNEMKFIKDYLKRNSDADYICLLDTGSTDGTWEYLQKEAKKNSKLIIAQKTYDNFRFDTARNDSFNIIPDDTDIIIRLDLDEYFSDNNWREIIEKNITLLGKRHLYITHYRDNAAYNLTEYPQMLAVCRITETKKFKFNFCVHEVLSNDDWDCLGSKGEEFDHQWNKLLVIHEPDKSKPRDSYIALCEQRCTEKLPVYHDESGERLCTRAMLIHEYYRADMYDKALEQYEEILKTEEHYDDPSYSLKDLVIYNSAACMYKMTNDIKYIREAMKSFAKYGYSQHLLYFALKDDLENTKQYKDIIEKQLEEHDKYLGRFVEYDVLGNKIKELAENLNGKTKINKTITKPTKSDKKPKKTK